MLQSIRISIFFCLLSCAVVWGQNAAVVGAISRPSGQPISGAQVTLANAESGSRQEETTNAEGAFRLSRLQPGSYSVTIEFQGAKLTSQLQIIQSAQVLSLGTLTLETLSSASSPGSASAPPTTGGTVVEPVKSSVTVTARRIEEELQTVPVAVSVVDGNALQSTQAFNVNRLKELLPTVQFYTSNPRNSAINIRGLGSPFGLTNDGIEPGVGFYVDGVFYARPASATMDFLDLERIEVLRGPQGTLYGKNTTAGAISITSRKPSFTPETNFELSYGNVGFIQAKGSLSGPINKKMAARLSFSGTQRDGLFKNVRTGDDVNDLNNLGVRTQLLLTPNASVSRASLRSAPRLRLAAGMVLNRGKQNSGKRLHRLVDTPAFPFSLLPTTAASAPEGTLKLRRVLPPPFDQRIASSIKWRPISDTGCPA